MPPENDGGGGSAVDRVREELSHYLEAQAKRLLKAAEGRLIEFTEKMAEGEGPGSELPKAGAQMLRGESPARAVAKQGAKGAKDKVVDTAKGAVGGGGGGGDGGGGGGGGGGGKAGDKKVTNIVEVLDVGLPLRRVYDHWTEFEEFTSFMKGVVEASRSDDVTSEWTFKVGPSKRHVKATVEEQVPDERIVWKTSGEVTTHGAISFHELAPSLTRIVVVVEYSPSGFLEKTGNIWRVQGRRLRLDLKHFQRYVTLGVEEEPEGWRGEIRDGEVVRGDEEGRESDSDDDHSDGGEESDEGDDRGYDDGDGDGQDDDQDDDQDGDQDDFDDEGDGQGRR
ncbi:SRPBCC family protein [Streptomyces sp. TP-A0874]|uniref:SRPBCC family protein n=1 Tax=Streptomyces sp. TP-A0874 TaxID=549819 RepID=UPI0008532C6F|nr:SRPBCC family protein [Streptomyces sp. TP-A0874]